MNPPAPLALLDLLKAAAGARLDLAVDGGGRTVTSHALPRYVLSELLAASNDTLPSAEEREWVDVPAAGREPL